MKLPKFYPVGTDLENVVPTMAISPSRIDKAICDKFGYEYDRNKFVANWYMLVGSELLAHEKRGGSSLKNAAQNVADNMVYFSAKNTGEEEESKVLLNVLEYLETNYVCRVEEGGEV